MNPFRDGAARRWGSRLALLLSCILMISMAGAYSEESALPFLDPATGDPIADTEVSSIHFDLVEAMAIAAGFSEADTQTIMVASTLTDIQKAGSYNLGVGALPATPNSRDVCEGRRLNVVWPLESQIECPECFTSRFGAFSPFFHFPHDSPTELGMLSDWAAGRRADLQAYAAFAYGGTQVIEASCIVTQTMTIDTGPIVAGSLDAFGIYLHALGDSWSHRDCVAALDAAGAPWGTHTDEVQGCGFTAHLLEFGAKDADTERTRAGVEALYAALSERSIAGEGMYVPLPASLLSEKLDTFVYSWKLSASEQESRRAYAQEIRDWAANLHATDPKYGPRPPRIYLAQIQVE